jgi:hypothetical protein
MSDYKKPENNIQARTNPIIRISREERPDCPD